MTMISQKKSVAGKLLIGSGVAPSGRSLFPLAMTTTSMLTSEVDKQSLFRELKFEPGAEIGKKEGFRSGNR